MYPFWDICADIYPKLGYWTILDFMIASASNCWMYDPPALALSVGQYVVTIMVLTLFFPCSSIYEQQPRLLNSWPAAITLHDNSSSAMISVPPFWNGPSEMVTRLYPGLILLVLNHPSVLFYIFSFMEILIQLLFNSEIHMIDIDSLMIVFF